MNTDELKGLLKKSNIASVAVEYHSYGYFSCVFNRHYYKCLPVRGTGATAEIAVENTEFLLSKVEEYEKKHGVIQKSDKSASGSFFTETIKNGDIRISLRASPGEIVHIASFYRVDEHDFIYCDEPEELDETCCRAEDYKTKARDMPIEETKANLQEGEELWVWDDIRFLSGSAGLLIVKDGKAIKRKCIWMS